jgi:hypothetical protein
MAWSGHEEPVGGYEMHTKLFYSENVKGTDHMGKKNK